MRKLVCLLIFLILLSGAGALMHVISPPAPHKTFKAKTPGVAGFSQAAIMDIKDADCTFVTISEKTMDYLKNRSEYKKLLNKKLVVYKSNSGHLGGFINATEGIQHRIRYKKNFNFYRVVTPTNIASMMTKFYDSKEDAQADSDFVSKCHDFCIINPKSNQLFVLKGYDYTEETPPEMIFDKLERW